MWRLFSKFLICGFMMRALQIEWARRCQCRIQGFAININCPISSKNKWEWHGDYSPYFQTCSFVLLWATTYSSVGGTEHICTSGMPHWNNPGVFVYPQNIHSFIFTFRAMKISLQWPLQSFLLRCRLPRQPSAEPESGNSLESPKLRQVTTWMTSLKRSLTHLPSVFFARLLSIIAIAQYYCIYQYRVLNTNS